MISDNDERIRTRPCPDCYLCGSHGKALYQGLKDRLFGVPGDWNLKHCLNPACGLVWLDPMPIEEEICKAYRTYYTHQKISNSQQGKRPRRFFRDSLHGAYSLLLRASPIYWERKRLSCMYLDKMSEGRLLEVGCGSGQRLARMRALGWKVEGQEVDPKAAAIARTVYGLKVCLGKIEKAAIADDAFDAIIMNHVIEHVYDPIAFLAACYRMLKPGGKLVAVTPNIESRAHGRFGSCWRGLEPPRHLHLFSVTTIRRVAQEAGFINVSSWTTAANAEIIAKGSLEIRRAGQYQMSSSSSLAVALKALCCQFLSSLIIPLHKYSGEECVLRVVK